MVAAHDTELFTNCHFLVVLVLTTNRPLADTGPEVSVIPHDPGNSIASQVKTLWAANDTGIRMHAHRSLTPDLDLNCAFRWVFIVADVPYPIIGTDFL